MHVKFHNFLSGGNTGAGKLLTMNSGKNKIKLSIGKIGSKNHSNSPPDLSTGPIGLI
jgi:hypothetical protein